MKNDNSTEQSNASKPMLATGCVEERKTIFDYFNIFRIQYGARYHAYDYACQVCNKSFKLYEEAKTDKEREMSWEIAKIIASKLNAPIPIVLDERRM